MNFVMEAKNIRPTYSYTYNFNNVFPKNNIIFFKYMNQFFLNVRPYMKRRVTFPILRLFRV